MALLALLAVPMAAKASTLLLVQWENGVAKLVTFMSDLDLDGHSIVNAGAIKVTNSRLSMRPTVIMGKLTTPQKPTPVDRGATTGFSMPLYATDEELFFNEYIAGRWDGATDINISIIGYLDTAETANDDFALNVSWVSLNTTSGMVPSTFTDVRVVTNVPSGRNAQYSIYRVDFIIDWDSVRPVIQARDYFAGRIRRTAVGAGNVEIDGEFVITEVVITYSVDKVFKSTA